jgi:two-component SAPR family response regulator
LDLAEGVLNRLSGKLQKAEASFELAAEKAEESKSAYNLNLVSLEKAIFFLKSGIFSKAIELAEQAYQFFNQEGHQVESHRAAFCCALSHIAVGEMSKAYSCLTNIPPIILDNKYSVPLMIQARAHKGILHTVKSRGELRTLVSRILGRIEIYEEKLQAIRKKVRQQATIVPFEPPRMLIQSFGKTQVSLRNKLVSSKDWQTQASKDLFFLLLANPNGMTKDQVGLDFWPEATSEELKLRFKNTLYRLRRAVGRQTILLEEDYYLFNRSLDYEYDVEKFTSSIELSRSCKTKQEKIKLLISAVDVYKGEYLPEIEGIWAIAPRMRYHQMYLESLLQLGRIQFEEKEYQAALNYCAQALSDDACQEEAHRLIMRIHAAMGNRVEITRQYERCCLALQEEINASPSSQTTDLYETLMK